VRDKVDVILCGLLAIAVIAFWSAQPIQAQISAPYLYSTPIEEVMECEPVGQVGGVVVLTRCVDEDYGTICYINLSDPTAKVPACRED